MSKLSRKIVWGRSAMGRRSQPAAVEVGAGCAGNVGSGQLVRGPPAAPVRPGFTNRKEGAIVRRLRFRPPGMPCWPVQEKRCLFHPAVRRRVGPAATVLLFRATRETRGLGGICCRQRSIEVAVSSSRRRNRR